MLEKERENIKNLTLEIVKLSNDPKNRMEIKQDLLSVQSSINKIAEYANPKNYKLNNLTDMTSILMNFLSNDPPEDIVKITDEILTNPSEEWRKKLKGYDFPLNKDYPAWWSFVVKGLNEYCTNVNSIRFDFKKNEFKITLPKIKIKIKNLILALININK